MYYLRLTFYLHGQKLCFELISTLQMIHSILGLAKERVTRNIP